jgi:hypothetical protein
MAGCSRRHRRRGWPPAGARPDRALRVLPGPANGGDADVQHPGRGRVGVAVEIEQPHSARRQEILSCRLDPSAQAKTPGDQAFLRRVVVGQEVGSEVASAAAFFRVPRAVDAVSAGSAAALRPPATGNSKDRWRRSEAVLARFGLISLLAFPGGVCASARLRLSASIRLTTLGGAMVLGLIGRPFIFASINSRSASW